MAPTIAYNLFTLLQLFQKPEGQIEVEIYVPAGVRVYTIVPMSHKINNF